MARQPNLYLHDKTGVYYFRKVIPEDVRTTLGVNAIKRSLGTKDYREAAVAVLSHIHEWEQKIAAVRDGTYQRYRDGDLEFAAVPATNALTASTATIRIRPTSHSSSPELKLIVLPERARVVMHYLRRMGTPCLCGFDLITTIVRALNSPIQRVEYDMQCIAF